MKQRTVPVLLAVAILATSTACLDYEEVLTLNADGSGHVVLHIAVDKQILGQMEELANPNAEPSGESPGSAQDYCSEDDIRAALSAMGSGLELVSYRETDDEQQLAYDIEFNFSDYEDFRDLNDICPEEGTDGEAESQFDFSYVEQADGTLLFTRRFMSMDVSADDYPAGDSEESSAWSDDPSWVDDSEATDEAEDVTEPPDLSSLAEKLQGLGSALRGEGDAAGGDDLTASRLSDALMGLSAGMQMLAEDAKDDVVRLVVHFPGEVIESNGTTVDAGTVTWEYTLDAMDQAPKTATARVRP